MPQVIQTAKGVTVVVSGQDDRKNPPVAAPLPGPVTFTALTSANMAASHSDDQTTVQLTPVDPTKDASIEIQFTSGDLSVADSFVYTAPVEEPVATSLVMTVTQN